MNVFRDTDIIEIDPDSTDVVDLVHKLMPSLVKIAFKQMHTEREIHRTKYGHEDDDDDDQDFPYENFDSEGLKEKLQSLIYDLSEEFTNMSNATMESSIKSSVSKHDINFDIL